MQKIKKIVTIGPESTGKSTLCSALAKHFSTSWCPEYAREYLLQHGTDYTFETLAVIAKGQLGLEEAASRKLQAASNEQPAEESQQSSIHHSSLTTHHSLLFIDTNMYVMKVWCEYVFGKCHPFILEQIVSRQYDLYLLCNTDLPWTKDELREYPDEKIRLELFNIYKDILVNQNVPWIEVKGNDDARLQMAIDAVKKYCL